MTRKGPEDTGKDAFIALLKACHEESGRPSYTALAAISQELPRLYPPAPGAKSHFLPLPVSTISEVLGGKRKGLPSFDLVASFVLCCQRHAYDRYLLSRDPGTSSLPWWARQRAQHEGKSAPQPHLGPCKVWLSPDQQVFVAGHGPHGLILLEAAHAGDPDATYRVAILLATDPAHHDKAVNLLLQAVAAHHVLASDFLDANPSNLPPSQAARVARSLARIAEGNGSFDAAFAFSLAADRGMPDAAGKAARRYWSNMGRTGQPPRT